jgi:hypothetical protein
VDGAAAEVDEEPTGFMTALATRSLDTAASGWTPKNSTSTGVMSAPPPMPVRPTTMPIPKAATGHQPVELHERTLQTRST